MVVDRGGPRMKIALFGADGKVGSVLGPALAAEGYDVTPIEQGDEVGLAGHDAAVDFTQPDAVARNVLVRARARRARRGRHDRPAAS